MKSACFMPCMTNTAAAKKTRGKRLSNIGKTQVCRMITMHRGLEELCGGKTDMVVLLLNDWCS
jgi:hypothetical protein